MALAADLTPDSGASGPPGDIVWTNPGNAVTCDGVYATCGPITLGLTSTELLILSSYDVSALNPSGHITGIEVHLEAFIDQGSANVVQLNLFRRGLGTGDNKAATPVALTNVEIDYQFGADGDLWSSSFRTVSDFTNPNTGFQVRFLRVGGPDPTVSVDCMTLTCYFTNSRPFIMRFGLSPRRATLPINRNQRSRI